MQEELKVEMLFKYSVQTKGSYRWAEEEGVDPVLSDCHFVKTLLLLFPSTVREYSFLQWTQSRLTPTLDHMVMSPMSLARILSAFSFTFLTYLYFTFKCYLFPSSNSQFFGMIFVFYNTFSAYQSLRKKRHLA